MRLSALVVAISCLLVIVSASYPARGQEKEDSQSNNADERMAFMQQQAEAFKGSLASGSKIKAAKSPLLRWTNPHTNIQDGVLVAWTDESGVPAAAAQICLTPNSTTEWAIELQSLANESLMLGNGKIELWEPEGPGVTFQAYPELGVPGDNEKRRLVQMRALARRFRGDDDFENEESQLRLLTNPLVRYAAPDRGLIDGGLFALVHGTDPEMLILIEAREEPTTRKRAYHWALAPMTSFELRGYLDRKEVWHKPKMTSNQATDVFFQRLLVGGSETEPSALSRIRGLFGL